MYASILQRNSAMENRNNNVRPLKLPDGQQVFTDAPVQKRRYRLYDKIKISKQGMDLVIVVIIALLLVCLIAGIALARG